MKKKALSLHYIILLILCQVIVLPATSYAIDDTLKDSIVKNCSSIKSNLKNVQKADAKARVFLGGYYEIILTKFITPLNVRLVENNLSTAEFVENQNKFAEVKTTFANDYVKYQKTLEELLAIDCGSNPEEFYSKLTTARDRRKIMEQDSLRLRNILSSHIKLVNDLKGKL